MFPGETILSDPDPKAHLDPHISELRVLRSGAGYYIGTLWTYCDCERCQNESMPAGMQEPHTRETDYFGDDLTAANLALATFRDTGVMPRRRR